jgi:hypothetical protein
MIRMRSPIRFVRQGTAFQTFRRAFSLATTRHRG